METLLAQESYTYLAFERFAKVLENERILKLFLFEVIMGENFQMKSLKAFMINMV